MFKPQFAPLVKSGAKRQTIRPLPKRMPRAGEYESWREWIGLPYRSKQRELAQVKLTSVDRIKIKYNRRHGRLGFVEHNCSVAVNGKILKPWQVRALSERDGFSALRQSFIMFFWNNYGLPFKGILIRAKDL